MSHVATTGPVVEEQRNDANPAGFHKRAACGYAGLVVIGNPENRRVAFFREAAARLKQPPPREIAWLDLLTGRAKRVQQVPRGALVRIDSPGENAQVETALIALGAKRPASPLEHGQIGGTHHWFLGFEQELRRIQAELEPLDVFWMNHPSEIPLLFDKTACQAAMRSAGIPTAETLPSPQDYEHLRSIMAQAGHSRVFVKLRYGSSGSGVVAFETSSGKVRATTSVELVHSERGVQLFNSLRVRTYTAEEEVALLVNQLCREPLHVEAWIPKAGWQDATFDLRIVVIAGRARHVVMRTSRGPITNLHLGNKRGDVDAFLRKLPPAARKAAWATCEQVAQVFPRSLYFGVDLLFTPGFRRHSIIEVNAFGDLLPGILSDGDDTYTAELRAA